MQWGQGGIGVPKGDTPMDERANKIIQIINAIERDSA